MATTATPKTVKTTTAKAPAKRTPKPKVETPTPEPVKTFRVNKRGFNRNARVVAWHKRLMPIPTPATVTEAFSGSDPRSTFVALKWDGSDEVQRVHFTCVKPMEELAQ